SPCGEGRDWGGGVASDLGITSNRRIVSAGADRFCPSCSHSCVSRSPVTNTFAPFARCWDARSAASSDRVPLLKHVLSSIHFCACWSYFGLLKARRTEVTALPAWVYRSSGSATTRATSAMVGSAIRRSPQCWCWVLLPGLRRVRRGWPLRLVA